MEKQIVKIKNELKKITSFDELDFLIKWLRVFSSKAHISDVAHDLEILQKISPPPQLILDFGCGIGFQSYLLSSLGYKVYGIETIEDKSLNGFFKGRAESYKKTRDESMKSVWDVIQKRADVRFRFYDGKNIPFPNEYFDVVFSYAVCEHIPTDELMDVMIEVKRVLKMKGVFSIFHLPRRASYTEFAARKLGMESHEILWDYKSIKKILNEIGFEDIFSEKSDMLVNHPHKITNLLFPIFKPLNEFLIHTPLSYFAHNLTIISKKVSK